MRRVSAALTVLIVLFALLLSLAIGYIAYAARGLDPSREVELFRTYSGSRTTRLYVSEGGFRKGAISEGEYKPILYDSVCGSEDRIWCSEKEIPRHLKDAFVAIEDHRFYSHDGVDWLRTARAAVNAILRLERRFGGSTITQQLVKNVSGENTPTLKRKVREILRATALERRLDKEEILTYYLNVIPLANRCYGVGAAARFYFDKDVSELTLGESASIAAITNAPSRYDPIRHPEANRMRRDLILRKMAEHGYISAYEAEQAMESELKLDLSSSRGGTRVYTWYTEQVLSDVTRDLTDRLGISRENAYRLVYLGGLKIYTCCDAELQNAADRYFERYAADGAQGGMVLLDPRDGSLLAIEGALGKKTVSIGLNYASGVKRPPGSTLKPIALYAPALSLRLVHYGSVLEDLPLEDESGSLWPRNTPLVYDGRITLHRALAKSKNTVAVRLYEMLGAQRIADILASDYGINVERGTDSRLTDLAPAPLALGQLTEGASLLEMTAAYGVFASNGVYRSPRSYLSVYTEDGRLLLDNSASEKRVLSEENAYIMTEMLSEVVSRGTASAVTIGSCIDVAGKTGTSSEARDRWMIGYSPDLLLGVLLTGEGQSLSGGARQVKLWDELMRRFHARELSGIAEPKGFRQPRGILYLPFCPDSGERLTEHCLRDLRGSRVEYGPFTLDNLPNGACRTHLPILFDRLNGRYRTANDPFGHLFFERRASALDDRGRRVPNGIEPLDRPYDLSVLLSGKDRENAAKKEDFSN